MSVPKVKPRVRKVPRFRNEDEEREFWASHDSTEFVDWRQAERVKLPNLRPKRDIPYQSLLKMFVADKIEEELPAAR